MFVVFEIDSDGIERLKKVAYWNMPFRDRLEAQRVWEETKNRVAVDAKSLPRENESSVAHVRPKAKNSSCRNISPQGEMLVNKCFWLNRKYIGAVIAEI